MSHNLKLPHPNCYRIPGSRVIAGEYPFHPDRTKAHAKLRGVLDCGVTTFVDLTEQTEFLTAYEPLLRREAAQRGHEVAFHRLPIVDNDVPTPRRMAEILGCIAAAEEAGHTVYVHCWGGVGRTGTVVGCYLVRKGLTGEEALAQVRSLFATMSPSKTHKHRHTGSPQTETQREFVRRWAEVDPKAGLRGSTDARATYAAESSTGEPEEAPRRQYEPHLRIAETGEEESFEVDIDAVLRELEADVSAPSPLLPVVRGALDEREIAYELNEQNNWIRFTIKGTEASYICLLHADDKTRLVCAYVIPPVWVPESARPAMCEAIARANYGLACGAFDMDVGDGELRYRACIDVEGGELVPTMVHNLVGAGIALCNRYHAAFMRIIYGGATPEEAIGAVES